VLVVEDDPAVRLLVVQALRDAELTMLEAPHAEAALPIIEAASQLDLLVTDVGLPGVDGRQLAEMARERRPGLPVLLITGYAKHAAIRSGFLGQGMDMLTKPLSLEELVAKATAMIGQSDTPHIAATA
jgi:CheY-like chemotaxis protein